MWQRYSGTNFGKKWLGQPTGTPGVLPTTAGILPLAGRTLVLRDIQLQNRAASAAAMALVGYLPDSLWTAGQWVHGTTTLTDDTVDAQDPGGDDFPLEQTTTGYGFMVSCIMPFGAVGLDISTASSGGSPVRAPEYWTGAAWKLLPAAGLLVDVPRTTQWAAGENLVLFDPPMDWVVGGSGTGVPAAMYNLRVRDTTAAPTTAAVAQRLYVGVPLVSVDALTTNGWYQPQNRAEVLVAAPILGVSLATSVADIGSTVQFQYAWRG